MTYGHSAKIDTVSPKVAFITGITGQDGSYLAEKLIGAGWEVHGLVRVHEAEPIGSPSCGRIPGILPHEGQLSDPSRLDALIFDIAPDVIFNLGGISSVYQSWQQPYATALISGSAVIGMLDSAVKLQESAGKQIRFFQASSAEIFGQTDDVPQTEQSAIRPVTPYGAAKALAHQSIEMYRKRGLFACSGILYNHESPRRPDTFVTRKITKSVAAIASGQAERLILGNLAAVRDWGWAPDFVDAMVLMALAAEPDDYIVATGESHSVEDFVAASFASAGIENWSAYVESDSRHFRPSDRLVMLGDNSKIRSKLGWQPTTTFAEIVAAMVAHDLANVE